LKSGLRLVVVSARIRIVPSIYGSGPTAYPSDEDNNENSRKRATEHLVPHRFIIADIFRYLQAIANSCPEAFSFSVEDNRMVMQKTWRIAVHESATIRHVCGCA
jgi:hypothetical protein